jgi:hypothetical protein
MAKAASAQCAARPSSAMAAQASSEAQNTSGPRASRARTIGITAPAATAPMPTTASIRPKAAGPSSSRPRTTSGSRAQTAEAKTKKAQARRMAARMAGAAATKPIPARMAPSRRSRGSPPRAEAGRRQASSAQSSARKARALSAKAAAGPDAARTKPPSAGPSARARLKPMPFSAMAPTRSPRGTSSGVVAAQAGKFTAVPAPMAKVSASRPQGPSASAAAKDGQQHAHGRDPELRRDQRAAAVEDVGRGAAGQGEEEDRQHGGRLHQADHQRRGGERGHQPAGAGVLDPHAGVGGEVGDPERPEGRVAEGAKALADDMVRAVLHGWMAPVPHR